MKDTRRNARIRLSADFLNKASVGLIIGGLAVLVYGPQPMPQRGLITFLLMVVGLVLHLAARHVIGKLEP
jgi:F0F1-type ATP synthase assembly protein I